MASRKFKQSWIPTALLTPLDKSGPTVPPLPPPRTMFRRAAVILQFVLSSTYRELKRYVVALFTHNSERSLECAQETRQFCERMGGLWVILARLMALRVDLLGQRFCNELSQTRDRAVPISLVAVQQILEAELKTRGTCFSEVFANIDEAPLAARSFGQMHRAQLKSGRQVVVRVRLPDAAERARSDARWLKVIYQFIKRLDIAPHLRWDDLVFETKKAADDILDFRTEINELRQIRKILRPRRIYVPLVFSRLCTAKLLITEYIEGVRVSDLRRLEEVDRERCEAWLVDNRIHRGRVFQRIFNAHYQLLFEHNFFFTELLPASVILLRSGRLAFVSLGTIGTIDAELKKHYRGLAHALTESDFTKACDTYLAMGPALPYTEIANMRQACARALRKWESKTHVQNCQYREKSLAAALQAIAQCATEHALPSFWNLARLQLAERLLEPTLEYFGMHKSSLRALRRYDRTAQLRSIKRAASKNIKGRIHRAADVAQLQFQQLENMEHDGEYLRRRLMGFSGKIGRMSKIVGRMLLFVGKCIMLGLLIQLFLYSTQRLQVAVPLAEQGGIGKLLGFVRIHNRSTWIVLILFLFFFRRFLRSIARQLFSPEVRPSDVL